VVRSQADNDQQEPHFKQEMLQQIGQGGSSSHTKHSGKKGRPSFKKELPTQIARGKKMPKAGTQQERPSKNVGRCASGPTRGEKHSINTKKSMLAAQEPAAGGGKRTTAKPQGAKSLKKKNNREEKKRNNQNLHGNPKKQVGSGPCRKGKKGWVMGEKKQSAGRRREVCMNLSRGQGPRGRRGHTLKQG